MKDASTFKLQLNNYEEILLLSVLCIFPCILFSGQYMLPLTAITIVFLFSLAPSYILLRIKLDCLLTTIGYLFPQLNSVHLKPFHVFFKQYNFLSFSITKLDK